jgi:lysophospholipase L1-like esterase
MRTLRLLVPLLVAVGLVAVPGPAIPAPAERSKPAYPEYVALGDSWTADVVILNADGFPATEHAPIGCAQSHRNYPKLVAKAIRARTFRDASCGSATTDDFTHPQTGLPTGGANPPQFDRLTRRTDLVTVGIGGNDAGIAAAGMDCLNLLPIENPLPTDGLLPELPIPFIGGNLPPLGGCKKKYTKGGVDRLARNIRESEPKLVRALRQIHRISPEARILLVDYMSVVPDHACYPLAPATHEDMRYIHNKFRQLNAMLARAARKGGAEIVKTHARTVGHDLCKGARVRYAETLGLSVNDPAVGVPAHPNAAGARAQAASVMDYLKAHPR